MPTFPWMISFMNGIPGWLKLPKSSASRRIDFIWSSYAFRPFLAAYAVHDLAEIDDLRGVHVSR